MARFDGNAAGEIVAFWPALSGIQGESGHPPGVGVTYSLRFDEETNAGLIQSYQSNPGTFAIPGGTLTQNGTPASIAPPAAFYAGVLDAASILAKANSGSPHNWTTEEIDRIAAVAFRGADLG